MIWYFWSIGCELVQIKLLNVEFGEVSIVYSGGLYL